MSWLAEKKVTSRAAIATPSGLAAGLDSASRTRAPIKPSWTSNSQPRRRPRASGTYRSKSGAQTNLRV